MERNLNHKDGLLLRSATAQNSGAVSTKSPITTSPDFVLQWGHRKRLRCTKVQLKDRESNKDSIKRIDSPGSSPAQRTTARVDRRVVRSDYNKIPNQPAFNNNVNCHAGTGSGYLNLRQRPASPSPAQRILRNSDSSTAMRGHSNGVRGVASPVRGGGGVISSPDGKGNGNHNHNHQEGNNYNSKNNNNHIENNNGSVSPDSKKGGGGSSSGSDAIPAVWPPRFVIALSNKEKEEDFWAIKRSKLPQRPKKRAKFIQRTLSLVSPGAWLCDLTLERYEVREKKVSKKRPRGLKAMGTMDSDSE